MCKIFTLCTFTALNVYVKDREATGEFGSFRQISGLKCAVHTDIPTSVEYDEDLTFTGVGKNRRASVVQVRKEGKYVPIDPKETYVLAASNYMIREGGCGIAELLKDHHIVMEDVENDYQVLIDYMQSLNGDFSAYAGPEGRVNIVK